MPFCTMCGAELAPEAKFCGSCGAAVEQAQPQQAVPQQPQYQPRQAVPQQPQYQPQQAAPQQPQYQPQQAVPQQAQPQYQQAVPQQAQPQYQQVPPQYQQAQSQYQQAQPQQPVSKPKIDYLPNAANDKTTRFMWGGVAAALIAVALLFISRTSGFHLNGIWYGLSIASTGLSCIAMVSVFLSLRKGLAGQSAVMPQLFNATAILAVVVAGLSLLAAVLMLLGDSGVYKVIRTLSDLYEIASLAYLVCFVIVAVRLLMVYEGTMKNLAIVMLVVPAIGLLMVLLESRSKAVTILFTIGIQGAYCYLYYLAHLLFTGKKLV
ncbi:MAG: zinc ribbon domain-containing protein [Bacteroidales bacterium]|nr:zinc ribbon domain-containing protein [Bacteroidales bacterium]